MPSPIVKQLWPYFLLNNILAGSISLCLNSLLIVLIAHRTPKSMRSYGRIIRIHCISDIIYDIVQLGAGSLPMPLEGTFYTIMHGVLTAYAKPGLVETCYSFAVWMNSVSVLLFVIDFYYRYRNVCQ
jgi:hypothetical protein